MLLEDTQVRALHTMYLQSHHVYGAQSVSEFPSGQVLMTIAGYWPPGSHSLSLAAGSSPKNTDSGEEVRGQVSEVLPSSAQGFGWLSSDILRHRSYLQQWALLCRLDPWEQRVQLGYHLLSAKSSENTCDIDK